MRNGKKGRPSKLNEATASAICRALQRGATYDIAAGFANINVSTLYSWLSKGREGREPWATFYREVKSAEAAGAMNLLHLVHEAAIDDPKYACWILERRHGFTQTRDTTPPVEITINAAELDVRQLLIEAKEQSKAIAEISGPIIDLDEE